MKLDVNHSFEKISSIEHTKKINAINAHLKKAYDLSNDSDFDSEKLANFKQDLKELHLISQHILLNKIKHSPKLESSLENI